MNHTPNEVIFKNHLLRMEGELWKYTPKLKNNTDYYAVIVEPREDFDMKIIMKTVMYFLNETKSNIKWGLQIFHGTKNVELIKKQTYNWGDVTYTDLNVSNLTKQEDLARDIASCKAYCFVLSIDFFASVILLQ